jgi:hypothetical protein
MTVLYTGNPISSAEDSLPPIAYTVRPNCVRCASQAPSSTTPTAMSALTDSDESPPMGMRACAMALYTECSMLIDSVLMT